MFERKHKATDEAVQKAFGQKEHGSTVLWETFDAVTGCDHLEGSGPRHFAFFQRWMKRERRMILDVIKGVGFRVLTHEEVATICPVKRERKARRQVGKALSETDTVDGAKLSDHVRRVFSTQRHALRFLRLQIGRAYREAEKVIKKSSVNPVRKVEE